MFKFIGSLVHWSLVQAIGDNKPSNFKKYYNTVYSISAIGH